MKYTLALDIGTGSAKCALFGSGLSVLAEADAVYDVIVRYPSWAEQNAEDWWKAASEVISRVISGAGVLASDITAIAVSGQAPSVLLVDKKGVPLYPALIWMDRRSDEQCHEFSKKVSSAEIYNMTGTSLDPCYSLSKLLWIKKNFPEMIDRAHCMLQANGYIVYKLTGVFSIDIVSASQTQLLNVHTKQWCSEILEAADISKDLMPRIAECSEVVGTVTQKAAEITGLAPGTLVLAGTVDASAAVLEAGVIGKGEAVEMTGTSSGLLLPADRFFHTPNMAHQFGTMPGMHITYGSMNTTGASYKWFRDELYDKFHVLQDAYSEMDQEICHEAPVPTKIIFHPYLSGERCPVWDSKARGTFVGISLSTQRSDMMRAVLEGVGYALRDNLEEAKGAGFIVKAIHTVGGCSRSLLWNEIKASILNVPFYVHSSSKGALGGVGILLSVFTDEFRDIQEALSARTDDVVRVMPNSEWVEHYNKMYFIYRNIYRALKPWFNELEKV